jgi:O-acetyl-ADP-ribose deacetylase (regulator of RNase III)
MEYLNGNLLEANTQALVNTVNTVGVMGKGIALQFKKRFPINFKLYADACKKGEVKVGKMFVVREHSLNGEVIIINFPTKTEWFKKSHYAYIEDGLKDLAKVITEYNIQSISLPPLGCGNGGLNWDKVKILIEKHLGHLSDITIHLYTPDDAVNEMLQKKAQKKEVGLTAARAMLLDALYTYVLRGEDASVFAANKLAYFLQRSGEKMNLQFVGHSYGPYAQAVEKVLYALNGKYLKGLDQMKVKAFEPLQVNFDNYQEVKEYVDNELTIEQKERLKNLYRLIDGFESSLALEILASVDFLRHQNRNITENELFEKIQNWNDRKKNLIKKEYISIAIEHLDDYGRKLHLA